MCVVLVPERDTTNLCKYGVSLPAAAQLVWVAALEWNDDPTDHEELSIIALPPISARLFSVVFVDRDEAR
jgi:hypothetical protein